MWEKYRHESMNRRDVLKNVGAVGTLTALPITTVHGQSDPTELDSEFEERDMDFLEITVDIDHSVEDTVTSPICRFEPKYFIDEGRLISCPPRTILNARSSCILGTHQNLIPMNRNKSMNINRRWSPHGNSCRFKNPLPKLNLSSYENEYEIKTEKSGKINLTRSNSGYEVESDGIQKSLNRDNGYQFLLTQNNKVRTTQLEYDNSEEPYESTELSIKISLKPIFNVTMISHPGKYLYPDNMNWRKYIYNLEKHQSTVNKQDNREINIYSGFDLISVDPKNGGDLE